jgi:hypothetical protein
MKSNWDTVNEDLMSDGDSVRPIDRDEALHHRPPPKLTMVAALLAIGGVLGWGVATLGGASETDTATPAAAADASPIGAAIAPTSRPTVTWTQASVVPAIPPGMGYAGFSTAVELNGTTYLVVDYASATTKATGSQLWHSTDGDLWEADTLWLGEPVSSIDLTAFGDSLLLGGTTAGGFGLWTSIPDRSIDGSSWNRIPLSIPEGITNQLHATRVSGDNRIVAMMIGNLEIYPSIIEPYLPHGIDLSNERYRYLGDQFIYGTDGSGTDWDPIQIFAEPPSVLVADDSVWIRLVTTGGDEVLQTVPLPDGVYPVDSTPNLTDIPVAMMWRSDDVVGFLPVTGSSALPEGYFLPEAWGNDFVAAVYARPNSFAAREDVTLWTSHSGRAWQPAEIQPPRECSPFFLAVSKDRIHLTSEIGTQCIRDVDGTWQVLDQPSTATYVVGGDAGFIGYPDSFEYDQALFSEDGVSWANVTIPTAEPYPTLVALQDRLLALSVNRPRPTAPTQIDVWVGAIGS